MEIMEDLHVRFQIQNWLNSGLKKKSTQRQRCCKESKTFPYTERKMSWSSQWPDFLGTTEWWLLPLD